MRVFLSFLFGLCLAFTVRGTATAAEYDTWSQITDEMNTILDEAAAIYQSGDERKAVDTVNVAYFQLYEKLGVERNVRKYISVKSATDVEYQFAMLKKLMVAKGDKTEVVSQVADLKEALTKQGAGLDARKK